MKNLTKLALLVSLLGSRALANTPGMRSFSIGDVNDIVCIPSGMRNSSAVLRSKQNADGSFNSIYFFGYSIKSERPVATSLNNLPALAFGGALLGVTADSRIQPDTSISMSTRVEFVGQGVQSEAAPNTISGVFGILHIEYVRIPLDCTVNLRSQQQ